MAFLSAMVIGIVWLFEFFHLRLDPFAFTLIETVHPIINKLVIGFACFAFLISFAREIIKDLQDVEGDRASGCRTLPVVIGINKSRILAVLVILITMFCLAYFQFILIGNNISVAAWYLCLVQALLISTVVVALFKKPSRKIFGIVSTLLKIAMITGICSMIFIPMI